MEIDPKSLFAGGEMIIWGQPLIYNPYRGHRSCQDPGDEDNGRCDDFVCYMNKPKSWEADDASSKFSAK